MLEKELLRQRSLDIEFPKELNKKGTIKEFEELMKFNDNEIPIGEVNFLDYPDLT
ncbi:MAG: hypothetical protein FWF73_04195 [Spirochaetes bacterium]|nr:hypothetical protein [Spirochaetota bacterium]